MKVCFVKTADIAHSLLYSSDDESGGRRGGQDARRLVGRRDRIRDIYSYCFKLVWVA
jgi:hypothetical protein